MQGRGGHGQTDRRPKECFGELQTGAARPLHARGVPGGGNGVEHADGNRGQQTGDRPLTLSVVPRRPGLCPREASVLVKEPDLQVSTQATGDLSPQAR